MSDSDYEKREIRIPEDVKRAWGEGPWVSEADRVEWRCEGFPCLLRRGPQGSWCGYVGMPPGHPWHGLSFDEAERRASVHGGVTFAEPCADHEGDSGLASGPVCHVPREGEPAEVFWLGFDYGHGGEFMPKLNAQFRDLGIGADRRLQAYDHEKALRERARLLSEGGYWRVIDVYTTEAEARRETEYLARQAAAVARGEDPELVEHCPE